MTKGAFKRTLKWKSGDIFAVPLSDGSFGLVQAVAPISSFAIDFFILSVREPALPTAMPVISSNQIVAIKATWRTTVTGGHWAKLGNQPLLLQASLCPNQQLIAAGSIVGCEHSSSGLVEDFMSACHGLLPWNMFPAHDFDSYLLDGISRPQAAKLLDAASLQTFRALENARTLNS